MRERGISLLDKGHDTNAYQAEVHDNENPDGETFHLHKADEPLPGEICYVTDTDSFNEENNIESYVLYLTYEEYAGFDAAAGLHLPGIKMEHRRNHYSHVVRVTPE
ncbi:MAG: hypothetical protein WAX07_09985 [Candidatus Altiarchaeia archaeon]